MIGNMWSASAIFCPPIRHMEGPRVHHRFGYLLRLLLLKEGLSIERNASEVSEKGGCGKESWPQKHGLHTGIVTIVGIDDVKKSSPC